MKEVQFPQISINNTLFNLWTSAIDINHRDMKHRLICKCDCNDCEGCEKDGPALNPCLLRKHNFNNLTSTQIRAMDWHLLYGGLQQHLFVARKAYCCLHFEAHNLTYISYLANAIKIVVRTNIL